VPTPNTPVLFVHCDRNTILQFISAYIILTDNPTAVMNYIRPAGNYPYTGSNPLVLSSALYPNPLPMCSAFIIGYGEFAQVGNL